MSEARRSIGDYVRLQRGTTYKSSLLGQPGPVLLGLGSIARNGGFKGSKLKTYGGPSDPRILLESGDIYVSLKDVTQSADLLGAVAKVPEDVRQGRLTQDTVKLVFKDDDAPRDYIYWLLQTPVYREYCRAHATGTTNLGLSREDFFAFPVPPYSAAQVSLQMLLTALESKIELNRRMNETLVAMARAIFKDWFVDFGPTRAKMEGRSPHLAPEVWALFPDRFDDEEKPEGWALGRLDDLLVLQRGFDLPASQRLEGPYPVIAASGFNGSHAEHRVRAPGVTTGRSGVLGRVFYVQSDFWPLNTSLWVKEFKASAPIHAYFTLQEIDLNAFNAGSAVPTLNRNHVHSLPHVIPPPAIISVFDKLAVPLMKRLRANEIESETLAATRDLLLPKLVPGEVSVREAEATVARAA